MMGEDCRLICCLEGGKSNVKAAKGITKEKDEQLFYGGGGERKKKRRV
jgi:hypothetical protein